jgi:hypothetical protein
LVSAVRVQPPPIVAPVLSAAVPVLPVAVPSRIRAAVPAPSRAASAAAAAIPPAAGGMLCSGSGGVKMRLWYHHRSRQGTRTPYWTWWGRRVAWTDLCQPRTSGWCAFPIMPLSRRLTSRPWQPRRSASIGQLRGRSLQQTCLPRDRMSVNKSSSLPLLTVPYCLGIWLDKLIWTRVIGKWLF